MSLDENKVIVRRYQEIYNSNNLDAHNNVLDENFLGPRIMPGMNVMVQAIRNQNNT